MYTTLFNAITDALEKIEKQNIGLAREQLIAAQQQAEEIYISVPNKHSAARTGGAVVIIQLLVQNVRGYPQKLHGSDLQSPDIVGGIVIHVVHFLYR